MLEKSDLELLKSMMEKVVDTRATKTEAFLLEEIERAQKFLDADIEKIQTNIEELKQYYKITKLENDNTAILLQMVKELSERVAELEKRTA